MAQPNKQGKTMSSRLLTMKFMQRGAASPSSAPSTPPEPPSKKQRLSNGSYQSTPASTPRTDAQVFEEAQAAEDTKRAAALEREAAARGDSKWYLSFKESVPTQSAQFPLQIVSVGYSTLDASGAGKQGSSEGEDDRAAPQMQGRRSFGKFNRKLEKQQNEDVSSDSESSSESPDDEEDEDDSDDPIGAKAMIAQTRKEAGDKARVERKAKRKAEKAEAGRMADERRKKHVKLNHLSSISGGGGGGPSPSRSQNNSDMICYKCGKKGHGKWECSQSPQQQRPRRH
ncbi:hypothetical protein LTR37_007534 [Vermiconidia calcicola]|uniref:Uncharacterized protein n=1 Tax=Vermiconidia calcicola TaxID=1690605 RepID=A0ACC3NFY0_9PEZI|nr:hypothetical protein LTR37_007534 [Vermiconidia calcicola]